MKFWIHIISLVASECCHAKFSEKCCDRLLGSYPHISIMNQFLTQSQDSALHIAGTYAAKKALAQKVNCGVRAVWPDVMV